MSDLLVTDYSSVIYEFSLLGRPMVFFAPDRAAYERERGFYFDYVSGVPGPVFETSDPLARHIRDGVFDLGRVEAFRARRSTSPTAGRRPASSRRSCCRRCAARADHRPDPPLLARARGAVRYAPRPSRRQPVEHATGPFTSHDLPSQTRHQALPPSLVGEPGSTQLLHRTSASASSSSSPWSSSSLPPG